jgi:filamentous hemagglutinin family protein
MAGCLSASLGSAQTLPKTTLPVNTLPVQAPVWLQKGLTPDYQVKGNAATVNLKGPATILNWNSLDVGQNASLNFNMVNPTDRVLNNVSGGAINNRTTIDGMLKSNGQVYIVNPNGIVFSKTATVDVNALVASSLKMDNQRFMDGILSASSEPQLKMDTSGLSPALAGAVVVEGDAAGSAVQKAAITAARSGFIVLAAPQVSNAGVLKAPDGQVLLAAGTRVFLAAPSSPAMRGLLVEVGSDDLKLLASQADRNMQPTVTNSGKIDVQRGNATLVGRMVNQMGLVSASTSANLNGSIFLKAQDGATIEGGGNLKSTVGGTLALGPQSLTRIDTLQENKVVDLKTGEETTELSAQYLAPDSRPGFSITPVTTVGSFKNSKIDLAGQSITMQSGSQILAPGAEVSVTAKVYTPDLNSLVNNSQVVMEAGSSIDVSGSSNVPKAMASFVVTGELRGGELADNLLLRDSALRGQSVRFDVRKADGIAVANLSGYVAQVGKTIGEWSATGGTVAISAEGNAQLQQGSRINVSGGWVDVQSGYVNTSKLSLNGRLFDLETAPANLAYTGVVNLDNSALNFQPGYRIGYNAGSVSISAPNLKLQTSLKGEAVQGILQRNLSDASTPRGGSLSIDMTVKDAIVGSGQFVVGQAPANAAVGDLALDVNALFNQTGFRSVSWTVPGDLRVNQNLALPPVSKLTLKAPLGSLRWTGNVSAVGGSVTASALYGLDVAAGVGFDLAGAWLNDAADVLANPGAVLSGLPTYAIKGGSLSLSAKALRLNNGVNVDVSGGAWLSASGRLSAGSAGSITLSAKMDASTLDTQLVIGTGVQFAGYGLKSGGSLALAGRNLLIGQGPVGALPGLDLWLSTDWLNQGGFTNMSLTANGNLQLNTQWALQPQSWRLPDLSLAPATGTGRMRDVATVETLPLSDGVNKLYRPGVTLNLAATTKDSTDADAALGQVRLGAGSSIVLDPGLDAAHPATVTLNGQHGVDVQGEITVPGGQVQLLLGANAVRPYVPDYGVVLGSRSKLDVTGSDARLVLDKMTGLASGEVLAGGSIRVGNLSGTALVPAVGFVRMEPGAAMDVSGAATPKPWAVQALGVRSDPQVLVSGAGSVEIQASELVSLGGTLKGQAGGATAAGGSLSVVLDRVGAGFGSTYPAMDRVLRLDNGFDASRNAPGVAVVPVGTLASSGFTQLSVKSQNRIELGPDLNLSLGSKLVLDAPSLVMQGQDKASLSAPYMRLGNADSAYQTAAAPSQDGAATLTVKAGTLDLQGVSTTQGIGQLNVQAQQDIRLLGVSRTPMSDDLASHSVGSLDTGHSVNVSAQQIYPTTFSEFAIALHSNAGPSNMRVDGAPGVAAPVLSAGGSVSLQADQITQAGRLLAPLGHIQLTGRDALVLTPGSVTSVTASPMVLMGRVLNGTDWTYTLANIKELNLTTSLSPDPALAQMALPSKGIQLTSGSVKVQAGAVLDLSGGGVVRGLEFLPGPGGSSDILANSFAVLPGFYAKLAPVDAMEANASLKLGVGDQVYLSGVTGLAAGYYTLLPGHYAMLPGGFALQMQPGLRDMSATSNVRNADGSWTVAGRLTSSTDGRGDVRTNGFKLIPQAVIRKSSEIREYDANTVFADQALRTGNPDPALPQDGGRLVVQGLIPADALKAPVISLQGQTHLEAGTNGQRGQADISAPQMEVVSDSAQAAGTAAKLLASEINALQADSVLLGGQRTLAGDGVHVQTVAQELRISNTGANPLVGSEWLLTANQILRVNAGANLQATGSTDHAAQRLTLDAAGGAFLAVSTAPTLDMARTDRQAASPGALILSQNAAISASGSAWLDATESLKLDARLNVASGGSLGISAPTLSLGDGSPTAPGITQLNSANLGMMSRLNHLALAADRSVAVNGTVNLGSDSMASLDLKAAEINGLASAAGVPRLQLTAQSVQLAGRNAGSSLTPVPDAGGIFSLNSAKLGLGAGLLSLQGFSQTTLSATGELYASGAYGVLRSNGALTVKAPRLDSLDGAAQVLQAQGDLTLLSIGTVRSDAAAGLGGSWNLRGRNVDVGTWLYAPSGTIQVQAAGDATTGVNVSSGRLDVHGTSRAFGSGFAYSPAGRITLDGGSGNVTVGAPAVLDLSAAGADAGELTVRAVGGATSSVVMNGQIKGQAVNAPDSGLGTVPQQGRFNLDVQRLDAAGAFDAINGVLDSAGMTAARNFRVRQGDVNVAGNIQAQALSIAVDNGNLTVSGTLDARGAQGGQIGLYAGQASAAGSKGRLELTPSARLLASATVEATSSAGSEGDGGRVVLSTANADGQDAAANNQGASLNLQKGAAIDVSAAGLGNAGSVVLRAPRTRNGKDVAVAKLDAQVIGSGDTSIEAVRTYQATSVSDRADSASNLDAGSLGKMAQDANQLMTARDAVLGRLAPTSLTHLSPGLEVRSSGDLMVAVAADNAQPDLRGWNLNTWRFGQEAGTLSLRAIGDLNIVGSISDGFVKPVDNRVAMPDWQLDTSAKSWSLRLVGGADMLAAKPDVTVVSSQKGDVRLGFAPTNPGGATPLALVRTGTGQIDVAAGRDVVLQTLTVPDPGGNTQLDQHWGAAIYTAGHAVDLAGANTPLNGSNPWFGSTAKTAAAFGRDGGGLSLTAGRDVVGAALPQMVNDWLFRQGRSELSADGSQRVFETVNVDGQNKTLNTAWWARPDYFGTGVATLGGGNLTVRAAGSVKDLNANVATNAYMRAGADAVVDPARMVEQGGGDLSVRAGQDVLGGQFYVQKGKLSLRAEGDIGAGSVSVRDSLKPDVTDSQGNDVPATTALKPVMALGNASADIQAGGKLAVESIYNPTLSRQSVVNLGGQWDLNTATVVGGRVGPTEFYWLSNEQRALDYKASFSQYSGFSTYGAQSTVRMTAAGGQAVLGNDGFLMANTSPNLLPSSDPLGQFTNALYVLAPPRLKMVSFGGNVLVAQGMGMAAEASGQLELMAQGSVQLGTYGGGLYRGVVMLDNSPQAMTTWAAPALLQLGDMNVLLGQRNTSLAAHTPGQLHANDTQPVRVVALTGNVQVLPIPTEQDALPTAALVLPKKVEIVAKQDIVDLSFAIQHNSALDQTQVIAGRDVIDSTDTNKENPVAHVITGPGLLSLTAGRDIDLGDSRGVISRGNLDNVYLPEGGASVMATAGLRTALPDVQMTPAVIEADAAKFMTDVVAASKKSLTAFDQAIAQRYAPANLAKGSIKVFGSQFKTEQGGAIDLAAPKGSVIAGLVNIPPYLGSKKPAENGLFTVRGGDLRVFVAQDFSVNQGRVFTLGGGDITMVSQYGNIDAGRGSKTASSAPPPLLTTDASGNTKIDISGSISGSGIATLKTSDKQPASDVVALAPRGIFDAGDAGVRSTGKVEITAAVVLNANNISAAGGVTGVVVDTGAAAAPPAASSATAAPDAARAAAATAAQNLTLSVDVVGYGSEASPAPEASDDKDDTNKKDDTLKKDDANKKGEANKKDTGAAAKAAPVKK